MHSGSNEIGRRVAAKATGIAFAITYLWAVACGADGLTALTRASLAAGATLVLSFLLCQPVVGVVLDAIARDEARRREAAEKETDT